jgi:hypothetical protein
MFDLIDFNILILWDIYGILSTNRVEAGNVWLLKNKHTIFVQNIKNKNIE